MSHLPVTDPESRQRLEGIGLICAAVTTFSLLDTSAKFSAAHGIPTLEIVWCRYALSVLFSVILLRPWRRPADYRTKRPIAQAVRALFLLASTGLNFIAIQHLQLAQTVSISFAAPLIVTALAGPTLGEWAGPRRWAAVIVGFIGVLIVIQPEPRDFQPAALLSVGAAFGYAGYGLTTRMLAPTETPASMLVYGSLLAAIVLTPALPAVAVAPPSWLITGLLAMTGISAAFGHWLLILANRRAPATLLAPFAYVQLMSMVLLGYLVFGDVPHPSTIAGAIVIIGSGLYILYRERVHRDR